MKMLNRIFFVSIGLMFTFSILEGLPLKPTHGTKLYQRRVHEVNNVYFPITNFGNYGQSQAHTAGTYFPKGSGEAYIFGAGIWVAALIDGTKSVACGYNPVNGKSEYCPGPPEHAQDHINNPNSHPEDRIYFSTDETDLAEWPDWASPPDSFIISDEDAVCEYTDSAEHEENGPLGLHIRQHSMAWNDKYRKDIVFILYEIKNVSNDTIKAMYVGAGCDMDIGDADDDLVGCDVPRSLGWTYDPTKLHEEEWIHSPPYYVGIKFLQGPKADDTVYVAAPPGPDNPDYPNTIMDTVYPGERLPLTSFTKSTRNYDAVTEEDKYMVLAGYNLLTGEYDPWIIEDNEPDDKRMILGCGPFNLAPGEVDTFLIGIMFSNGNTGGLGHLQKEADIAQMLYDSHWKFPSSPASANLTAIPGDRRITLIWDDNPLATPDLFEGGPDYRKYDFEGFRLWKSRTGLPGEWELLKQWDLKNDIYLLPDDYFIPGYGNASGDSSANEGLEYFYVDSNVINGIPYYYALTPYDYNVAILENPDVYMSMERGKEPVACTPRSNTGDYVPPSHSYTRIGNSNSDSIVVTSIGDIAVTGKTYELRWEGIKESGGYPVYTYNIYDGDVPIYFTQKEVATTFDTSTIRHKVRTSKWTDVVGDTTITIDSTFYFIDTTTLWSGSFKSPFDGILVDGAIRVKQFEKSDTIVFISRTFVTEETTWSKIDTVNLWEMETDHFTLPDSIKVVKDTGVAYTGNLKVNKFFSGGVEGSKWAYHGGSDIEIHWTWYNHSHDTLTIKVYDAVTGSEIPYDSAFGDNWCFCYGTGPANKYITGSQSPLYKIWFYVSGVWYYFNGGRPMDWTTRPDSGEVWRIYSSAKSIVPSKGNKIVIETEKFSYKKESDLDLIKVVPNPYLVRAMWDKSKDYRKILFTNLPNSCTIRIYTLSGDLIRTIEHNSTSPGATYEGNLGGTEEWDLLTKNEQIIASGVYIYHVSTPDGRSKIGKLAIIQ